LKCKFPLNMGLSS